MKIQICGSMKFANDMKRVKTELEKLGHIVTVPVDTEVHVADETFTDRLDDNLQHAIETDVIRENFKLIEKADGVLFLNLGKNNILGYIGASALMEMGIAHYFHKKIFLYNPVPDYKEHRWAHEVSIMQPIILNGDLTNIK